MLLTVFPLLRHNRAAYVSRDATDRKLRVGALDLARRQLGNNVNYENGSRTSLSHLTQFRPSRLSSSYLDISGIWRVRDTTERKRRRQGIVSCRQTNWTSRELGETVGGRNAVSGIHASSQDRRTHFFSTQTT